ncbi:hypothetical protein THAOC_28096, partial [Thalassiosira oceanica]
YRHAPPRTHNPERGGAMALSRRSGGKQGVDGACDPSPPAERSSVHAAVPRSEEYRPPGRPYCQERATQTKCAPSPHSRKGTSRRLASESESRPTTDGRPREDVLQEGLPGSRVQVDAPVYPGHAPPVVVLLEERGVGPLDHHHGENVGGGRGGRCPGGGGCLAVALVAEEVGDLELRGEARVLPRPDELEERQKTHLPVEVDEKAALHPREVQHCPPPSIAGGPPTPGERRELEPVNPRGIVPRYVGVQRVERHLHVGVPRRIRGLGHRPARRHGRASEGLRTLLAVLVARPRTLAAGGRDAGYRYALRVGEEAERPPARHLDATVHFGAAVRAITAAVEADPPRVSAGRRHGADAAGVGREAVRPGKRRVLPRVPAGGSAAVEVEVEVTRRQGAHLVSVAATGRGRGCHRREIEIARSPVTNKGTATDWRRDHHQSRGTRRGTRWTGVYCGSTSLASSLALALVSSSNDSGTTGQNVRSCVRPCVRSSSPKATEKRAVLCVTYYLGYLLEEVLERCCSSETGVEVNSKPISNFHPSANSRVSDASMHHETRRASNRRTTGERGGHVSSAILAVPLKRPLTFPSLVQGHPRLTEPGADALDAPMHHETSRRRPSRRPACTPQEILPPPDSSTPPPGPADLTASRDSITQ